MDLTNIKSTVLSELSGKTSLQSLKVQNHIYGCFLIMEDIAQNNVTFMNNSISTPKFSLDLDKQFSEIGIRYGFVMDTKLSLGYSQDYKDSWLKCFNDISIQKHIDEVDKIEDSIIEILQSSVGQDDAFFLNALDTGTLPQEWLEKVLCLLSEQPALTKSDSEEDLKKTAISQAVTEKPANSKHKRLASTRRANSKHSSSVKRNFAKTRRNR